jgi:hypothetical protein
MDINPFVLIGNLAAAQSYDTRGPDQKRQRPEWSARTRAKILYTPKRSKGDAHILHFER